MRDRVKGSKDWGLKQTEKYSDPDMLRKIMKVVDAQSVLERLGVPPVSIKKSGDEIVTFCPDHKLYLGYESSHPNWSLNLKSGQCCCRTEPRGSNIVFTAARILCSDDLDGVVLWMIGGEGSIDLKALELKSLAELPDDVRCSSEESIEKTVIGLQSVVDESKRGYLSNSAIKFFKSPPGKKPTNINLETLRHYGVFERTWGHYHDRVVIPYHFRGEIVGCAAIDKWGEKEWLSRNPMKTIDDYKKVLFLGGMKTSKVLFGFDDVTPGCDHLIITEAAREVMKLWQEGYKNSLALSGVSLSGDHMKLIAELRPGRIIIMLDGDKAGRRASIKIGEKLRSTFDVYVASPEEGCDPKVLNKADFKTLLRYANKVENLLAN